MHDEPDQSGYGPARRALDEMIQEAGVSDDAAARMREVVGDGHGAFVGMREVISRADVGDDDVCRLEAAAKNHPLTRRFLDAGPSDD